MNYMADKQKDTLSRSLKDLSEITTWFEDQEEIDVELALEKVQQAAEIIKICNKQLKDVENKFEIIQKDLDEEIGS